MRARSQFIGLMPLVVELFCSRATCAQGMYIGDGKGGYCTADGTPTAEHPRCTKAQVEAVFPAPAASPADEYVRRNNQALKRRADWLLHQERLKPVLCERPVAVVGGDLEQPFVAAVVCQNAEGRVLYEVLNHAYSPDRHPHVRVATVDQVDMDIRTISQGLGLAGDWWRN
jgi:hypothetical protein